MIGICISLSKCRKAAIQANTRVRASPPAASSRSRSPDLNLGDVVVQIFAVPWILMISDRTVTMLVLRRM